MKRNKILVLSLLACASMPAAAQNDSIKELSAAEKFAGQKIDVGADRTFTREEASAS